jgi:hypothetical protein
MKSLAIPVLTLALTLAGCASNTLSQDDGEPAYDVELRFSEDQLTTLQGVEIEALVRDEYGELITSLPTLTVEHRLEGESTWSTIEMAVHDDRYAADHRFMSSGEHEFRVMGAIDEHAQLDVMYVMDGHMEIERAHMEMDGMRVSYENFPADLREGEEATIRFWIEQMNGGDGHGGGHGDGPGSMMAGLSASVICQESDGTSQTHAADELEGGVYQTRHTFGESGEATMMVQFMQGGMMREASFSVPVNGTH